MHLVSHRFQTSPIRVKTDVIQNLGHRSPSVREQKWIVDNCRTAPEKELGPRPDLYENWVEPQVDPEPPPEPAVVTRGPVKLDYGRGRLESEVVLINWNADDSLFECPSDTIIYNTGRMSD